MQIPNISSSSMASGMADSGFYGTVSTGGKTINFPAPANNVSQVFGLIALSIGAFTAWKIFK